MKFAPPSEYEITRIYKSLFGLVQIVKSEVHKLGFWCLCVTHAYRISHQEEIMFQIIPSLSRFALHL